MEKNETVHISYPHGGEVDAMFAHGMMVLLREKGERIGSFNNVLGLGLLAKSRNIIVKHFLEQTTDDWILMIDSDEFLSSDNFQKLVDTADKDERPFVSGLYFAAWQPTPDKVTPMPLIFVVDPENGVQPYFQYPRNTVVDIYAAGTGCMLIHRSVLEQMREVYGDDYGRDWCWFQDGPIEDNKWLSEDLMFCLRLQSMGVRMVAHTGAVLPHHKLTWLMESHYLESRLKNTATPKPMP